METSIILRRVRISGLIKTTSENFKVSFWQNAERYRFAIAPMLLIIIGCLGGIAAGFGAQSDIIKLAMVSFPTIVTLALTLAVSPMRVIFYASIIAIVLDIVVFTF
jgi:hypothetical protein